MPLLVEPSLSLLSSQLYEIGASSIGTALVSGGVKIR